jgi:hypothetical protein
MSGKPDRVLKLRGNAQRLLDIIFRTSKSLEVTGALGQFECSDEIGIACAEPVEVYRELCVDKSVWFETAV